MFTRFVVIVVIYISLLIFVDSRSNIFSRIWETLDVLPVLLLISSITFSLRYLRWYWLMLRVGHSLKWSQGPWAYLAGFAFTATPGKVGELIRIKYFTPQGVSAWRVLAAFVFERACDLIAVLALASLAVSDQRFYWLVLSLVVGVFGALGLLTYRPAILTRVVAHLRLRSYRKLAGLFVILRNGLIGCRVWMTPLDLLVGLATGLFAWFLSSIGLLILLAYLGVVLPYSTAISIYPLAVLVGAASMLPGGIGSTEAALVFLLIQQNVAMTTATLAAVCIRMTSMWFAVIVGFVAMGMLEIKRVGTIARKSAVGG